MNSHLFLREETPKQISKENIRELFYLKKNEIIGNFFHVYKKQVNIALNDIKLNGIEKTKNEIINLTEDMNNYYYNNLIDLTILK